MKDALVEAPKQRHIVTDPSSLDARLKCAAARQVAPSSLVQRKPTTQREQYARHPVAHALKLEMRRQIRSCLVFEAGRTSERAKLLGLEKGVDVPSMTEAFDRVRRLRLAG